MARKYDPFIDPWTGKRKGINKDKRQNTIFWVLYAIASTLFILSGLLDG